MREFKVKLVELDIMRLRSRLDVKLEREVTCITKLSLYYRQPKMYQSI